MNRSGTQGAARLRGLPVWFACAGLVLIFTVPPDLLELVGFSYSTPSGSPLEKVHPGTDLVLLALALASIQGGNPLTYLWRQAQRFPGAVALLAVTTLLLLYLIKVQRAPFTPLIDTFVLPAFLLPLLVDLPDGARRWIERGLHLFLAFNAALGIVEFATQWRLIPVSFDGIPVTTEMEWRAAGLLGHPLASAATAGMYAIILAMGCGTLSPAWLRWPATALQVASLAAFGGRTALVLTLLGLAVLILLRIARILRGQRFGRRSTLLVLLLMPLAVAGLVTLANAGYFDQLLLRFVDDNGSAKSRALIAEVFRHFSWQELWFGPDQEHVASVLHLEGIEVGVESFWLGLVVLCGLWMSAVFFVGFGAFMVEVMRRCDIRAVVPLGFFLVVVSTTISLSAKTASLAQFVAIVIILMPVAAERARSSSRATTAVLRSA